MVLVVPMVAIPRCPCFARCAYLLTTGVSAEDLGWDQAELDEINLPARGPRNMCAPAPAPAPPRHVARAHRRHQVSEKERPGL